MKSPRNVPDRPYEVHLAPEVVKVLRRRFPGRLTDAVISFLQNELRFDPTEFGVYGRKLSGKYEKKFAAKQKRFHIIYTLDEARHIINVVRVDPL